MAKAAITVKENNVEILFEILRQYVLPAVIWGLLAVIFVAFVIGIIVGYILLQVL